MIQTFCFLDESGILDATNIQTRYFAIGAILHPWPDELIIQLHQIFEDLCNKLKKEPSRLEFKFSEITKLSLPLYKTCVEILLNDQDWRFFSVVIDLRDPKFEAPTNPQQKWECYLRWAKILLQKNLKAEEKATLIADYLRRPKGEVHSFATLPKVVPQLWDVIQVESQGVLLVQMADILLGASLFSGVDRVKVEFKKKVNELRSKLDRKRFNEWYVKWC